MTDDLPIRPHMVELLTILAAIGDDHRECEFFTSLTKVIEVINRDSFLTPAEIAAASAGDLTPLRAINRIRATFRDFDAVLAKVAMRLAPLLGKGLKLRTEDQDADG